MYELVSPVNPLAVLRYTGHLLLVFSAVLLVPMLAAFVLGETAAAIIYGSSALIPAGTATNAIESINARYRRAVNARGHFPNEAAAMKCLYLTTRSLDPTGHGRARWVVRWKPALNAFAITFAGRFERTTH